MKNTAKKILALVFAVAMICTLAVPVFAEDDDDMVDVTVNVINNYAGTATVSTSVEMKPSAANVKKALQGSTVSIAFTSTNTINKVNGKSNTDVAGEFGTGAWYVAVNGKIVSTDLSLVTLEEDDVVTVFWGDTTLGTVLAWYDDSAIAQGVVEFFYYDANGEKQPLADATIVLEDKNGVKVVNKLLDADAETDAAATAADLAKFTTDKDGQIWIAPEYLAKQEGVQYKIVAVEVEPLKEIKETNSKYTKEEREYINKNLSNNVVVEEVVNHYVTVDENLYNVAGSTGDMTMVYVLVAAAAIVTVGAVVVMKKKASKAQ